MMSIRKNSILWQRKHLPSLHVDPGCKYGWLPHSHIVKERLQALISKMACVGDITRNGGTPYRRVVLQPREIEWSLGFLQAAMGQPVESSSFPHHHC